MSCLYHFCHGRESAVIICKMRGLIFLLLCGVASSTTTTGKLVITTSSELNNVNTSADISIEDNVTTTTSSQLNHENTLQDVTLPSVSDRNNATSDVNSTAVAGNETSDTVVETTKKPSVNPFDIMNKGTVSQAQYEMASYVINVILKPIVCTCGIIMNIVGIFVLLHRSFRRSTYTYLLFLAISDVGYLLCGLIRSIPKIVNLYDKILSNFIDMHIFPYITMYADFAFTRLSVFLICAMSVERAVAVWRPLKVRELFLSRHPLPVCISLTVFCFLLYGHNLFIYYPKQVFNPTLNVTMYTLGRHPWYENSLYSTIFRYAHDLLNMIIPPVLLIVCNAGIVFKVNQARRRRAKLFAGDEDTKTSTEQRRVTFTLLLISIFFLIVFIPVIIVQVLSRLDKDVRAYAREHYFLFLMADVTSLAWSMSSANDFIVFIFTNKEFRKTLITACCPSRRKMIKRPTSTSDVTRPTTISS